MPELYGSQYSSDELRGLTGTLRQLAGIRLMEFADGKPRGMRVAEVYTGSGLRFDVLLDRGMDIGAAEFAGKPLAWLYPALGAPAHYEPQGRGWLRTFGGGLMTTCGLTHFGHAETDGEESLGLHGRISHIPAEDVSVSEAWHGDEYVLSLEGQARQAALFGENLLLTRRITTRLGGTSLLITDRVRNDGFRPVPHMILYHCNFGFPAVSPDSELWLDDQSVTPRDEVAQSGMAAHTRFAPPDAGFAEQVFFHRPRVGADGFARAAIVNRALAFGATIRYRAAELPYLMQWKMMGAGEYVCGLEPCNHEGLPRQRLRAEGRLAFLAPGEEAAYQIEIGVLSDAAAIASWPAP
ncbi:MAG: aldose 1-epimerase family protein [Chloroflexi bacterium]|nr:aldose 1-epimerase family protein [Chloroflexota bacterium]